MTEQCVHHHQFLDLRRPLCDAFSVEVTLMETVAARRAMKAGQ